MGWFYELMLKLGTSNNNMDLGNSWNTSSSVSFHTCLSINFSYFHSAALFLSFGSSIAVPKMALNNSSSSKPCYADDLILKSSSFSYSWSRRLKFDHHSTPSSTVLFSFICLFLSFLDCVSSAFFVSYKRPFATL